MYWFVAYATFAFTWCIYTAIDMAKNPKLTLFDFYLTVISQILMNLMAYRCYLDATTTTTIITP